MSALDSLASEIHVWCLDLAPGEDRQDELEGLLGEEERTTALCFVSELHRARFIAGRGLVREILAGYLEQRPSDLRFERSAHGKPRLEDDSLQFNFSHSESLGVLAVSAEGLVGIDVEHVRPWQDLQDLEELCFTSSERAELEALDEEARRRAFFRLWTRKEALLKATGVGLSHPLTELEVGLEEPVHRSPESPSGQFALANLRSSELREIAPDCLISVATDRCAARVRVRGADTWKTLPGGSRKLHPA